MQTGQLKRSLNLWHIVLLGVGYMTPMVVFDTFGIVSEKTGGHVPTAYVIALMSDVVYCSQLWKNGENLSAGRFILYLYTKND